VVILNGGETGGHPRDKRGENSSGGAIHRSLDYNMVLSSDVAMFSSDVTMLSAVNTILSTDNTMLSADNTMLSVDNTIRTLCYQPIP
jgi:hypothetical protein